MPEIVLTTLNARYIHASFGLRCLRANLGELRPRSVLAEFTLQTPPAEVAAAILALQPRIVGLGVYVWNVTLTTALVGRLKRLRPDLVVILGGPEVSHECGGQEIVRLADHVITGEADLVFPEVCRRILMRAGAGRGLLGAPKPGEGGQTPPCPGIRRDQEIPSDNGGGDPLPKIIHAPPPDLAAVALPYDEYSAEDVAHRLVYVEASRGCPFTCEFCLSSLDVPVRTFPAAPLLAALDGLLARGVRHFKFVDRTFNLDLAVSRGILGFFLARLRPGLFLHFEMIPDRLPPDLRALIARFPPGALQLEIGVQTFDPAVAAAIRRRQDYAKLEDSFRFLRAETGVHVHADLIAGLPGESLDGFAAGFDRLVALRPQEIQVGLLKRLRGTSIGRHDAEWGMVYAPEPPYEIRENRLIDAAAMQRLHRFARTWDLVGNSGRFVETTPLFWSGGASPFAGFMRFSDWFHAREGRLHGIPLPRLIEAAFIWLTEERGLPPAAVAGALERDAQRAGWTEWPAGVRARLPRAGARRPVPVGSTRTTRRQGRHRGTAEGRVSAHQGKSADQPVGGAAGAS